MNRKITPKLVLIFLTLVTFLEMYSVYKRNFDLEALVKPLIIISISIFYFTSAKRINKWYVLALFFSLLGDFFLLNLRYFLIGMSCFLIVHLIYVKITLDFIGKVSTGKAMLPLFFFLAFLLIMICLIKDSIDSFIVLLVCYGITLCSFAALSFFNNLEKPSKSNKILFLGAFIFIIVNSLIALNRFYGIGNLSSAITMGGYVIAQYLVCVAMIKKRIFDNSFNKEIVLLGVFILISIAGLLVITDGSNKIAFILIPLVFSSLILMYIGTVKKKNKYFLMYMFLVLIAEVLFLFKEKLLLLGLLSLILSQLILIYFVLSFKTFKIKNILFFFTITIISYYILYCYVVNIEGHFMYIIFGFVNAFLASLALDNYIREMRMPNYLLWLGISFNLLNNIIVTIDVHNTHLNVYAFVTNVISQYLICRSFIVRENRLSASRINS